MDLEPVKPYRGPPPRRDVVLSPNRLKELKGNGKRTESVLICSQQNKPETCTHSVLKYSEIFKKTMCAVVRFLFISSFFIQMEELYCNFL